MKNVLMLLTNAFMPDPRPHVEAMSLVRAGYKVKILCWDRGESLPKSEITDGIEIERIRFPSKHGRGTSQIIFLGIIWFKMLCRALKEKLDFIYCHDFDTLPIGLIVKMLKRKPLIFDSHDVYSKVLGNNVWAPIKLFIEYLEKTLIKKCDFVIVASYTVEPLYMSYGVKRIIVVENWKDPRLFQLPQETLDKERESLGIRNELVISFIANLGSERIIEPLLEVVREDRRLFLIVGGDGSQRALIEKAAQASSNIRFLGYVRSERVPLYTALSDIIYSVFDKNFGVANFVSPNKLFEALAAGKAFLGGNFGEMSRIINEEKCGIVLDEVTKETIKEAVTIFKDRDTLQAFKDNAKKAALLKYNWANAEKNLLKVFARLNS